MNDQFVHEIANILEQARQRVKSAVNLSMVYAYYEIGKRIVLEEQQGKNRAAYGQQMLNELSRYLTAYFGKGYSVYNLKLMRRFYTIYSTDQIEETVFPQSDCRQSRLLSLRTSDRRLHFCQGKKRRGNPYPRNVSQENGLPHQRARWFAMTGG